MKVFLHILFTCIIFSGQLKGQQKVDMVIVNAKVATGDVEQPFAEALAIKGHLIVAVGTTKSVLKWQDKHTTVIDAKGKTVIPGLYDSHLHVIRGGRFYNSELRWDGVPTLARALQMLKEQAKRTPKGQWVRVVGGWSEYQFAEKRLPTLAEINAATGKTPAFILHLYGQAFVNQAGMQQLELTAASPNPVGGLIQKDADGNPTGLLVAEPNAFILYSNLARLPELSKAEQVNSTRMFVAELNGLGVTSVMDAGGGFQYFPDDYAITDQLAKSEMLHIRLPHYLFAQHPGSEMTDYEKWIDIVDLEAANPHSEIEYKVKGAGENLVAAAGDFENFMKPRPELSAAMDAQLYGVLTTLVKNRWPFRLHATYDESISRFLDVIEKVNRTTPLNGLNWFFDHAETISEKNMLRTKTLGGGIAVQHRMAYQAEHFIARYGKLKAQDAPPVRRMINLGLKVGLGTDGTRVASYNPWVALYWLVTGKSVGGLEVAAKANQLNRFEALRLFTHGSASLINQDHNRGLIKANFLADLAILSTDYFTVDAEQIKTIRAELTILNGKVVHGTHVFEKFAPERLKAIPTWSPVNFYGGYYYQ